jgi:CBS domain-containing protein
VVAREADPRALKVREVMTRSPLLAEESTPIDVILRFMRDSGVRRVPVVKPAGEIVGVLSLDDVLERLAEQLTNVVGSIRGEQRAERVARP